MEKYAKMSIDLIKRETGDVQLEMRRILKSPVFVLHCQQDCLECLMIR